MARKVVSVEETEKRIMALEVADAMYRETIAKHGEIISAMQRNARSRDDAIHRIEETAAIERDKVTALQRLAGTVAACAARVAEVERVLLIQHGRVEILEAFRERPRASDLKDAPPPIKRCGWVVIGDEAKQAARLAAGVWPTENRANENCSDPNDIVTFVEWEE